MTVGLSLRTAHVGEHRILEALQRRASLANPDDREALLANPDAIELPLEQISAGHVFVGAHGGDLVGFAALVPREDGEFELDGLFVEPDLWKSGVGRALIGHCSDFARRQGAAALHVVGNPHAEGFYAKCGFAIIGSCETRFGPGILMSRPF